MEQNLDGDLLAGLPKDLWRRVETRPNAPVAVSQSSGSDL